MNTKPKKPKVKIVEDESGSSGCMQCFFSTAHGCKAYKFNCIGFYRKDGKNVHFIEVKE